MDNKEWLQDHKAWFYWFGVFSLLTLLLSIVIVPMLITRMAPDYFLEDRKSEASLKYQHPVLRSLGVILKNVLGGLLIIFGVLLSLPGVFGQGFLTILIGLSVMDFRGKRKLEIWMIRLKPVNKAINWIRAKADQPPLILPEKE